MSIVDNNRFRKTYSYFRPKPRFEAFSDQDNTLLKDAVLVATTGNITLSGLQTINGVSLIAGDSVLVKDQNDARENGIYVVDAGAWYRRGDMDHTLEVISGMLVPVISGSQKPRSLWMLGNRGSEIPLGSAYLDFVQFELSSSFGSFDQNASYVVMASTSSLTNERVLTAGNGLSLVDSGASSPVTLSVLSPFDNIAPYVTLAATSSLSNERTLSVSGTSGLRMSDAGAGGILSLTVNDGIVFTNTGSITFDPAITPTIKQSDLTTNGGTGATLTLQAQNETGASSRGGKLILKSGTGTSIGGNVEITANTGVTTGSIYLNVGTLSAVTVDKTYLTLGSGVNLTTSGSSLSVDVVSKVFTINGDTADISLSDTAGTVTVSCDNEVSITGGTSYTAGYLAGNFFYANSAQITLSASNGSSLYLSSTGNWGAFSNQFTWRGAHVGDSAVTETFRFGVSHVDAASSDITINATQHAFPMLVFTGTLGANISASFPTVSSLSGSYFKYLQSDCSGAFDINIKTVAGRDSATLPRQGGGLFTFTPKGVKRLNQF